MSTIETQHGAYLGSEPIEADYAAERTPLLHASTRSHLSTRSKSGIRDSEHTDRAPTNPTDSEDSTPTLPLLLTQFRLVLVSSLPVFGTHLLEYALLITSVLAVGHLGKIELAACTLGSMTANVTAFSIVLGMGGALDTVLPGVWGASAPPSFDNQHAGKRKAYASNSKTADSRLLGLWCQRMAVIYALLLVPMLCLWLNAERILVLLRQDKDVARLAGKYLAMLAFGLPAYSFNTIAKRYFQAQGLFSVPTKIGSVVAGVNVLLTGLLVYYPNPLPRALAPYLHLGFDGAPLSTAISYNLVAIGSALSGWKIETTRRKRREAQEHARAPETEYGATSVTNTAVNSRKVSPSTQRRADLEQQPLTETSADLGDPELSEMRSAWYPLSSRALHPTGLSNLLTLGMGGVGQVASEWWAWELVGLAASLLGPTALAAQSVLLVSCSTTYQVPFALGVATSVRIGQLLGLARPRHAKLAAHASMLLGLVISLIFSTVFWIWRRRWAYLFNGDEDVATMVASILPLAALFQVFDGNAAITGGILRARGKQALGALLNLSAYYVLGIPLGIYLAFKDVGWPDSLPDHPVVHSLYNQFNSMGSSPSPSSSYSSLPSPHFHPFFNATTDSLRTATADGPSYPSLEQATAGLRGLWVGLTVSLIYCAVFGTVLCLQTDWDHEVEKVRARVRAEEQRNSRYEGQGTESEDTSDGATFVDETETREGEA